MSSPSNARLHRKDNAPHRERRWGWAGRRFRLSALSTSALSFGSSPLCSCQSRLKLVTTCCTLPLQRCFLSLFSSPSFPSSGRPTEHARARSDPNTSASWTIQCRYEPRHSRSVILPQLVTKSRFFPYSAFSEIALDFGPRRDPFLGASPGRPSPFLPPSNLESLRFRVLYHITAVAGNCYYVSPSHARAHFTPRTSIEEPRAKAQRRG